MDRIPSEQKKIDILVQQRWRALAERLFIMGPSDKVHTTEEFRRIDQLDEEVQQFEAEVIQITTSAVVEHCCARMKKYCEHMPRFQRALGSELDRLGVLIQALAIHLQEHLFRIMMNYLACLLSIVCDGRVKWAIQVHAAQILAALVGLIQRPRKQHQLLIILLDRIEEDVGTPSQGPVRWIELCKTLLRSPLCYSSIRTKKDKIRLRRIVQRLCRHHPQYEASNLIQDGLYIIRQLHLEKLRNPKRLK